MISANCHCGQIRLHIPHAPAQVTNCNCSLCRRTGALWAYYTVDEVQIEGDPEHTESYIWGDKLLRTVRCRHCGSVTHWAPLGQGDDAKRMAVNIRMFEPADVGDFKIRRFDGAVSWQALDD